MRMQILDAEEKPLNLGRSGNIGRLEGYTNKITGLSDPRFIFEENENRWLHISTIKEVYSGRKIKNLYSGEVVEL